MSDTLALKYRPKNYSDIVGNENIAKILRNSAAQQKFVNAYFLAGTRGSGKTSSARIHARAMCCENPREDGEPCNACDSCIDILEGRHPDVIEIDAASENSVVGIRELIKTISYLPTRSKFKVVIIDEIHSLSQQAGNALLKTLEEPPAHVKFIFCTTDPHKVLDTIRSRCLMFHFKDIQIKDVVKRLKYISEGENLKIDDRALEFIAKYSNGGMRDAVMLLEQASFCKGSSEETIKSQDIMDIVGFVSIKDVQQLFLALKDGQPSDVTDWLQERLFSPIDIISSSINFLETMLYIKQGVSASMFVSKDLVPGIMQMSSSLSFQDIILMFNEFKQTLYDLRNLSVVNTATLFRFKMLTIYDRLHFAPPTGTVSNSSNAGLLPDTFKAFKEEFKLTRVPLQTLLKEEA